jgi:hypothetical protein
MSCIVWRSSTTMVFNRARIRFATVRRFTWNRVRH